MSPLESGTERKARKPRDRVRIFLFASLAILGGAAAFTAVCAIIWPVLWPSWVPRVNGALVLAGVLCLSAGMITWLRERRKG